MNNNFNTVLEEIITDLNAHKRPKTQLLEYYINERLKKSLQTYYKELGESFRYLEDKDAENLSRKLNKEW